MRQAASGLDVRIHRGAAKTVYVKLKDREGEPFDFTDMDVRLKVAQNPSDNHSLFEVDGEVVCQPQDGRVRFVFTPDMTEDLDVRSYSITIMTDDYVALQGRLGILPRNREAEE